MNFFTFILRVLLGVMILSSCAARSMDDYYEEGQTVIRLLVIELEKIHSRQDAIKAASSIKNLFLELVNIMIAAEEFSRKNNRNDINDSIRRESIWSDRLREELNRVYSIEGVQEIIEKYQEQSLYRLDAFEKKRVLK
jgi:hypothetical protein